MCHYLKFLSSPTKLKQLCAHRCLSEWALTTQQPQAKNLSVSIARVDFLVKKNYFVII